MNWLAINLIVLIVLLIAGIILEKSEASNLGTSALAKKTPAELRQIAGDYGVKVTGKAGNTWDRIVFFGIFMWSFLQVLLWIPNYIGISLPTGLTLTIVMGLWGMIVLTLEQFFVVNVPKLAYIITTNFFSGRMHVLTPGINVKYPWEFYNPGRPVETQEQREQEHTDVLSQRAGEIQRSSTLLTNDGIQADFNNWVVQWGPFLPLGPLNIRYQEKNVTETVADIVESTLYQEVTRRNAQDLRKLDEINKIEDALVEALAHGGHQKDKFERTIEERNGIVVEIAALGPIMFHKDYNEALLARNTVKMMREDAKTLSEDLGLEGTEAFNAVMIVNKEGVTKQIFGVEMTERTSKAVENLGSGIKAAGAAVAGALPVNRNETGGGKTPPSSSNS